MNARSKRARYARLTIGVALALFAGSTSAVGQPSTDQFVLRAVPVSTPIRVDGRVDEEFYARTAPMTDFIQTEPTAGTPISEKTELWVGFDRTNIYVTFRCWEDHPDRILGNELRRDNNQIIFANDNVAFAFDTYHDRRNSLVFIVGPNGGRIDGQTAGERQWTPDWNPVWDFASGRFDGGWVVEAAIPFTSMRYRPGLEQTWGFTARRMIRWKNEIAYWTPVPNGSAAMSIMFVSFYGTLTGLQAPSGAKNIEIKPYATASLTTDRVARPRVSNDPGGDVGVDAKYGLTANLTADLTVNTDFAQVEADEQQVNLTRFNLFFPEKREFFLENLGMFAFGGAGAAAGGGAGGDTPTLFYSRRIGLDAGRAVPIVAGGRLTGRVGGFEVGFLNIQSDRDTGAGLPGANFTVARVKRDLLRRSSVGLLATRRSNLPGAGGTGWAYGADARFAFGQNLSFNTYWARTDAPRVTTERSSYRAQADYNGDRLGVQAERLVVPANFDPQIGFVRRRDMYKSYGLFRFSPRPASQHLVRKYSWTTAINHVANGTRRVETRQIDGDFSIEFQNSDRVSIGVTNQYEFLVRPFPISRGVTLRPGGYGFWFGRAGFNFGQQRRMFGNVSVERGEFYDGQSTSVAFRAARAAVSVRLSLEPTVSINRVALSSGRFTATLVGSRITYTMTPRMFVSALVQYVSSASALSSNIRFRWEYLPGSELFVVYNEQRDTTNPRLAELANRSVIVKVNRWWRF